MFLYNIYLVALGITFIYSLYSLVKVLRTLAWVNSLKKFAIRDTQLNSFTILIPVLREQSIIAKNVVDFSSLEGKYRLVYITTQKEKESAGQPTTRQVLENIYNTRKYAFTHIHYPHEEGAMAHQLNYAIKTLSSDLKDDDYVVVFNADSKVQKDYINVLDSFLQEHENPPVVQQSALFIRNYNTFSNTISGLILRNISLLQSHWTLNHEIPRLRRTSSTSSIQRFFESGHIVGHGVAIKSAVLKKIGLFSTDYTNEDLPLGYYLGNLNIPIRVFPFFEIAESPRSIEQVIRQYTTWFYGTFSYPHYFFKFTQRYGFKFKALLTASRNAFRSYLWLCMGILWIALLTYPISINRYDLLVIAMLSFVIQYVFGFTITHNTGNKLFKTHEERCLKKIVLFQVILILPTYLLHTLGPMRSLVRIIKSHIIRTSLVKEKTER